MSEPFDRQERPPAPYGFIQWKGTNVCLDFTCECGGGGHVDGEFAYFVRCPDCGRVYSLNSYVKAIPLTEQEAAEYADRALLAE